MANQKRNLVHLECMRIIAIYFVMFNHTGVNGFFLFPLATGSKLFPLYIFMSIFCKFAVPLFFMISGALLLGRENESVAEVWRKRILRMVVILIGISIVYQVYNCVRKGDTFVLSTFLKTLYSSRMSTALWYMYAYIAMLMMLPLLRRMAKGMNVQEYVYLAIMSIIFVGVIPILEYRIGQNSVTMYSYLKGALFTTTNMVYFLMGYFFEHVLPEKYYTWKNAAIGIILSLIAIGVCCYMTVYRADVTGVCNESSSQQFHNCLIAIPTYTIYFCIKLFFMRKDIPVKVQHIILTLGGTTFGIYLLEGILRQETKPIFTMLKPVIHTMPACLIWILAAFILGVVVTSIIKKIPVIGKYI